MRKDEKKKEYEIASLKNFTSFNSTNSLSKFEKTEVSIDIQQSNRLGKRKYESNMV